jgi:deleted-in-malignant-brain-tumors protein 1
MHANCYKYTVEVQLKIISDPSPLPSNCTDYDVRLNQKSSMNRGIVQICLNGIWGTICSGGLNYGASQLMCAQLGFQGPSKALIQVRTKNSYI